ncbi:MAG TPA: hypothetical protein VMV29_09715 [Ktedonobacterales bacterium]|nr:hypothetical protein [Ktedonobacterales bacterium]
MSASMMKSPSVSHHRPEAAVPDRVELAWRPLYRVAGAAALMSIVFTFLAVVVFIANPPPTTVSAWFALFQRNGLLGLINLDLLMLVVYVLMGVIYFALYGALRHDHEPIMALATICGLASITTYITSNTGFNMLSLSGQYAVARTEEQRAAIRAAGQAMLAIWQGTAYDVSYVLGGVATLLIAGVMLRSHVFSRVTAYVGLILGVLMLAPATAGTIGLYLSLTSLVPTVVWIGLLAWRFFQLASPQTHTAAVLTHAGT